MPSVYVHGKTRPREYLLFHDVLLPHSPDKTGIVFQPSHFLLITLTLFRKRSSVVDTL
jgi:hypothetical protein